MKKVLICNYFSASNRGDAAIAEGLMSGIKQTFPDAVITIATYDVESAKVFHNCEVIFQPFLDGSIFQFKNILYAAGSLLRAKKNTMSQAFKNDKLIQAILKQDIVIATGGSNIVDCYGFGPFGHLWFLLLAKMLGKKTVLMGQSIGPLNKFIMKHFSKYVLNKIDCLVLRDEESLKVLKEIGVKNEKMFATADLAFLMPVDKEESPRFDQFKPEIMPGINQDGINVSISVRHRFPSMNQDKYNKYFKILKNFTEWLIEEFDANICFIATATDFSLYSGDDRPLGIDIYDQIKPDYQNKVKVLMKEYSPYGLSKIIENMNIHIGTRMHSNILASIVGTPFIGIGYEFKTIELMRNLDWLDCFQDINKLDIEKLKEQFLRLKDNYDFYKEKLEENVNKIKKKSLESFNYVK